MILTADTALSPAVRDELVAAIRETQAAVTELSLRITEAAKTVRPRTNPDFALRGHIANAHGHVDSTYQLLDWAAESITAAVE